MTEATFWTAVALRVTANPSSNAVQKRLTMHGCGPAPVIFATHVLLSVACAPLIFFVAWPGRFEFWPNLAIVAVLAVACNTLLVKAVSLADLSVVGPINAYKSVVSLLPAMWLLGEYPGSLGLAGIGLVVIGSYGLAPRDEPGGGLRRLFLTPGIPYRIAALVLSATEAVFLKRALLAADITATFIGWSICGFLASATLVVLRYDAKRRRREVAIARRHVGLFLLLAATTGLMQYSTLVTFAAAQVGYALALFQFSSLLTVLLGRHLFGERDTARRLAGAAVMAAGATLIALER